ncbi:hypothetical protein WDW37_06710 [Bdellovibrionota bacterium FG-1]
MGFFPTDPKKLKTRIRSYERALRSPNNDDGYGKRYLVGPMYLLLGDTSGAVKYYEWFTVSYSDDGGEPYNELCWALALYLAGDLARANRRLRRALFSNLYLVPYVIGIDLPPYPIWHGCNFAEPEYAHTIPSELVALWTKDALAWAKECYTAPELQRDLAQYLDLETQIKDAPIGQQRTELLRRAWAIAADSIEGNDKPALRVIEGGATK